MAKIYSIKGQCQSVISPDGRPFYRCKHPAKFAYKNPRGDSVPVCGAHRLMWDRKLAAQGRPLCTPIAKEYPDGQEDRTANT
jgi:hypothetical protein